MFRILRASVLTFCFSLVLAAADVDGVWKAEYTTPDGTQRQSTFHMKADGSKLTGKIVSAMGEAELKDGTINGEDVAFTVIRNFNGNEVTLKYAGKVASNEMKLKVTFNEENSFDIVAKKQ